jgi:hypothetical protein
MRVSFLATADDLVDVTVRSITRHRRAVFTPRLWGVGYGIVFGALAFVLTPAAIEVRVPFGFLTLFGTAVLYPWAYWRLVTHRLRRYSQSMLGPEPEFEVQVELCPDGVRVRQFENELLYPWRNIETVADGPDSLDFWTRPGGMLAVRKRAFSSPAQMDAFLDLTDSYLSRELSRPDQPPVI